MLDRLIIQGFCPLTSQLLIVRSTLIKYCVKYDYICNQMKYLLKISSNPLNDFGPLDLLNL